MCIYIHICLDGGGGGDVLKPFGPNVLRVYIHTHIIYIYTLYIYIYNIYIYIHIYAWMVAVVAITLDHLAPTCCVYIYTHTLYKYTHTIYIYIHNMHVCVCVRARVCVYAWMVAMVAMSLDHLVTSPANDFVAYTKKLFTQKKSQS